MDVRCIRLLRPYDDARDIKAVKSTGDNSPPQSRAGNSHVIWIDEDARYALMGQWGQKITVKGRNDVPGVEIQPLKAMDQGGFIGRASQDLMDRLYLEYGEEVLLQS